MYHIAHQPPPPRRKGEKGDNMTYLNSKKEDLFNGKKVTYRGKIYWANMTTKEVYAHSVDEEIAGSVSGYKVADITDNWDIVPTDRMKDGWHKICGWDVYVEGGYILRGIDTDRNGSQIPVYVYRTSRHGGYDREERITPAAFRAGLKRGTIILK